MKGILFTEPNHKATLKRRKVQTRREAILPEGAFGFQIVRKNGVFQYLLAYDENERCEKPGTQQEWIIKPKYNVGEKVFLKEPYLINHVDGNRIGIKLKYSGVTNYINLSLLPYSDDERSEWIIKRTLEQGKSKSGYCNKMFMPEWCANSYIEITGVKAELLQDISHDDCIKEGMYCDNYLYWYNGHDRQKYSSPIKAYATLISRINNHDVWNVNPVMWAYDYKRSK